MFSLWYIEHCLYDKWSFSGTNYNTHGKQTAEINFYLATWTFQIHLREFHNAAICICISIWLMSSCTSRSNISRITHKSPFCHSLLISSLPLDLSVLCTLETTSWFSFYFYSCCFSVPLECIFLSTLPLNISIPQRSILDTSFFHPLLSP